MRTKTKITIVELIRRSGREPGGGWPQWYSRSEPHPLFQKSQPVSLLELAKRVKLDVSPIADVLSRESEFLKGIPWKALDAEAEAWGHSPTSAPAANQPGSTRRARATSGTPAESTPGRSMST